MHRRGVGIVRTAITFFFGVLLTIVLATPALAAPDPSKVGDTTGNFSPITYLLIPVALILAFLTALALGPRGEPGAKPHREGGLQRALSGRDASDTSRTS